MNKPKKKEIGSVKEDLTYTCQHGQGLVKFPTQV